MSFHQRDQFGALKSPTQAYANFKELRALGWIPRTQSWRHIQAAYRKKTHKQKLARLARRKNRRA